MYKGGGRGGERESEDTGGEGGHEIEGQRLRQRQQDKEKKNERGEERDQKWMCVSLSLKRTHKHLHIPQHRKCPSQQQAWQAMSWSLPIQGLEHIFSKLKHKRGNASPDTEGERS